MLLVVPKELLVYIEKREAFKNTKTFVIFLFSLTVTTKQVIKHLYNLL